MQLRARCRSKRIETLVVGGIMLESLFTDVYRSRSMSACLFNYLSACVACLIGPLQNRNAVRMAEN